MEKNVLLYVGSLKEQRLKLFLDHKQVEEYDYQLR